MKIKKCVKDENGLVRQDIDGNWMIVEKVKAIEIESSMSGTKLYIIGNDENKLKELKDKYINILENDVDFDWHKENKEQLENGITIYCNDMDLSNIDIDCLNVIEHIEFRF